MTGRYQTGGRRIPVAALPLAWQVLAFSLLFALVAFGREAFRVTALAAQPRQVGP